MEASDVRLRERARQLDVLATLGELALNCEELADLFQAAVHLVGEILGAEYVHLLELSPDGSTLIQRCESRQANGGTRPADSPAPGEGLGADGSGGPALGDPPRHPRCVEIERQGTARVASVPVPGRGRPFGSLCLHWPADRAPPSDWAHLAGPVANVLAAAIARHDAERALAARERELRAVFDATQDAIVTADDARRVNAANGAARRLFGRAPEDLRGLELPMLCSWERAVSPGDRWEELQAAGRASGACDIRVDGLRTRTVEWSAVARILPGRHLLVFRDVTEQRHLQTGLALADRMASVGMLAAGIAHELNSPLAYVAANVAFASRELGAGTALPPGGLEDVGAALADAVEGTGRMRTIIQDLRIFSRPDDARVGPIRLEPVLESAMNLAWSEIKHRARLVRDLLPVPLVQGNEGRIGQVFLNLIVNAAHAIEPGAADRNEIAVRTRVEPDGRAAVVVHDTGCGIPAENLPRIFQPFFTTKPPGQGTGLGLSICHRIVSEMGGTIDVESERGRGTTFRVRLPAAPAPATTAAA